LSKSSCYTKRKQHYQQFLNKLDRAFNRFVHLKLLVLVIGLTASLYFFVHRQFPMGGGLFLLGIFLLIYLDIGHRKIIMNRKNAIILRDINEHSIWRLDGRWLTFLHTGNELRDDSHPYTSDLDIFGQGSLFQWINVTQTYLGRKKLGQILTAPPESISVIRERQTAIGELANSLTWRQKFLALGIASRDEIRDPDFLFQWVKDRNPFFTKKSVILSLRALPIFTIGIIIVYLATKSISLWIPVLALAVQYGLLKIGSKKRKLILASAGEYQKNLQLYERLLRQILKKDYQSVYLQRLKRKLFNRDQESVIQQLRKLAKVIELIASRYNALYLFFNMITLCDYQCLIALERWKRISGEALKDWLETIAEFEALASLSIIRYDHPEWATPELVPSTPFVTAEHLGHPLLTEAVRVTNPLQIGNQTKVILITGSNMSGKSTYLRTIGINLVLAFTGAPVCAATFCCAPLDIYTCMRISDNLEKNISTFYAEILRIKSIVEASAKSRPIFFLLDEIFKGTNSLDRHTGAKMLIQKLIQNGAIGLVSTHDLELGELAQEQPTVRNYHFQEHFQNNQLNFDYLLRPGLSKTRNALYLMKAAGIIVDDGDLKK
jgi:DNA mismatch repair ATPase MutS